MTTVFESVELLTLSSSTIALMRIDDVSDTTLPPPFIRTARLSLVESLRGTPPPTTEIEETLRTGQPLPEIGDEVLVFLGARRVHIDLTSHRFDNAPALTPDFKWLKEREGILGAVRRRLELVREGRPLGDARLLRRGTLIFQMPGNSEAQRATSWTRSVNELMVPADADLKPMIVAHTRDIRPRQRAAAAWALVAYPGDDTEMILRALLHDEAEEYWSSTKRNASVTITLHPVRHIAYLALRGLGIDVQKPPSFDEEAGWLGESEPLFYALDP